MDNQYMEQLIRVANLIVEEDLPLFRNHEHPEAGPDPRTVKRVTEAMQTTEAEAVLLIARIVDRAIQAGREEGLLPEGN